MLGQLLLCWQSTRRQHRAPLSSWYRLHKKQLSRTDTSHTAGCTSSLRTDWRTPRLFCSLLLLSPYCLDSAGLNYFQSVTPNLSAGAEVFFLPQQMRSGVGLCLRHQGEKHIAAMQLATTGILSAQYAHRVTDKVCVGVWFFGGGGRGASASGVKWGAGLDWGRDGTSLDECVWWCHCLSLLLRACWCCNR